MKLFLFLFILAAGSFCFIKYGPDYIPQERKDIVIYTSSANGECVDLTHRIASELSQAGLRYRTINIDQSEAGRDAMRKAMSKRRMHLGTSKPPVIVINGKRVIAYPNPAVAVSFCARPVYTWKPVQREWIDPAWLWIKSFFK